MLKEVFRYQVWHFMSIVILIGLLYLFTSLEKESLEGTLWGVSSLTWFWLAVLVPIIHELYVWLVWRMELYGRFFTSRFGLELSFYTYAVNFVLLFFGRLLSIIALATASQNSLEINRVLAYGIVLIFLLLSGYLMYSVVRYFKVKRALGIDHFDKEYKEPFVKKGIFRFTNNGMYIYGLLIFYIPGLLMLSTPALVLGLFTHLYIWAHYFCTELPDMEKIYGRKPD